MTTQIYLHFTSVCCKNWVGAIVRSHVNESWKYNWKSRLPKSFYPLNFFCAHPQASGFCLQSSTLRTPSAGYKLETPEKEIQNTLPCGCTNLCQITLSTVAIWNWRGRCKFPYGSPPTHMCVWGYLQRLKTYCIFNYNDLIKAFSFFIKRELLWNQL